MNLIDVYTTPNAPQTLYELLAERTPDQSISHKEMPTFEQHCSFIEQKPYPYWYLINVTETSRSDSIGSIYLTKDREIGLFIFNEFQGRGYANKAVHMLIKKHPGKFLANVNPKNTQSRKLWESLGGKILQHTYEVQL